MSRACRLLSLILVLAAAPALGDDSTIKTFKEPKVLDTPQATGRACTVLEPSPMTWAGTRQRLRR